jgi:hypothetical protein
VAFFDKKQEVIDIKLTQFGKNLLARGFFKPVYYRFYDDDILYDSSCAGFTEEQNRSEERILEAQRIKTQHLTIGVESSFDKNEDLINSGFVKTFMEIKRRQDPLIEDVMLRYALQNSAINSNAASQIKMGFHNVVLNTLASTGSIITKGVDLPIPQLEITSSFRIIEDHRDKIPQSNIPPFLTDSEVYMDISKEEITFLDKTQLSLDRGDIYINMEELGVDLGLDNFEIEIFEIIDVNGEETVTRLESEEEVMKLFDIKVDGLVKDFQPPQSNGRKAPKGRK